MAQKDRTVMTRTNVLEGIQGEIRLGERWPRKDKNRGPPDLPTNFRVSRRVERCLASLQTLQSKRTQYIYSTTLAVPLQFIHDSLPSMVQTDVNIFQPVERDVWRLPFDEKSAYEYEEQISDFVGRHGWALAGRRYHFWPIDVDLSNDNEYHPHWALIVLHLAHEAVDGEDDPDEPNDPLVGPYNHLESYSVIIPDHGHRWRLQEDRIAARLSVLLRRMDISVNASSIRQNPWVPPANAPQRTPGEPEFWSNGLRVFEMIRVWTDRLTESYCRDPHSHDSAEFWRAHSGWFNPDAVRANMIGLAAAMVNRAMDSTTRIAIEPILDHQLHHIPSGTTIRTQSMMPNRRRVGAFVPGSRSNPTYIKDEPLGSAGSKARAKAGGAGGSSTSAEEEESTTEEEDDELTTDSD